MTTAASDPQIVPRQRAADQGVADALESVLSDNTRRVYGAQWRLFNDWYGEMGLHSLPAELLTVARYTWPPAPTPAPASPHAARHQRHYQGARVGEARIAVSGPRCACRFKGTGPAPFEAPAPGRRPHRRQPRKRGRGFETAEQAEELGRFDLALIVVLSDAGLRRSEAAALTWGDMQRWDDGSGRITVIRSKTDVEAQGRRHEGLWTPSGRRALVAR